VAKSITSHLAQLADSSGEELLARRDQKYRKIGTVVESVAGRK
jgi:acetyl-CoA carboxylase alpha subunit